MERTDKGYEKWRKTVLERDNYTCQLCGEDENLQVHHIEKYSKNEDLRTDIKNGITLCNYCHARIYGKEELYADLFKELLKTPVWRKEKCNEDKTLKFMDYSEIDKHQNSFLLSSGLLKYMDDVYQFVVYCYMCENWNKQYGYSSPSIRTISKDCKMASPTVQKAIKGLEEKGFIVKLKTNKERKSNNCYYINYVFEEEIELKENDENKNN